MELPIEDVLDALETAALITRRHSTLPTTTARATADWSIRSAAWTSLVSADDRLTVGAAAGYCPSVSGRCCSCGSSRT